MKESSSKRNQFLLSVGLAGALAIGFLATLNANQVSYSAPTTASGSKYALTLNSPMGVNDQGKGYVSSNEGSELWFWFFDYDFSVTDRFVTLDNEGCFGNDSPIHSLKSITISIDYGCVDVYRGYQLENYSIEYGSSSEGYVVGDDAVDTIEFNGGAPAYFKVVASAYTRIKSVVLNYDCVEATTTDIELTVKAPSVTYGPTHKVADCNYLWFECNTTGEWNKQVMTRQDNGDWKINLTGVEVAKTYTCYLSLGPSATSSTGNYNAENNGFEFYVAEGQDKATIASPTFGGQHEIKYNVHVSVNITDDVPSSFGNMQFLSSLWDYNSWNNYHADYFTRNGNSFTVSKAINSTNYPYYYQSNNYNLYWKPYIWDNAINQDTFYNGSSGANLVITPDGSSDIYVIIDAAYPTSSSSFSGTLTQYTNHQITSVYGDPVYYYPSDGGDVASFDSYDSNALRILEDGGIMGLKAGRDPYPVRVTTSNGNEETFYVYVDGDVYTCDVEYDGVTYKGETYADTEGWFESHNVGAISGLTSDFFNGVDISSCYALYQHGSKFYNKDGYEQSLFSILKENHVNYVRLRLWVDPQSSDKVLDYGGGSTNLSSVLWMAKEAKLFGLKLLLDFHYSDFWAHPGQQILPKSWSDCTSKEALCARIKSYTSETLSAFEAAGCLPDMVQLGNEISSGIYLTKYRGGESESVGTGDKDLGKPSYLTSNSNYGYGTMNHAQYADYIKAASEGVDAVDSSIKKVLHFGKGSDSSVYAVNNFFAAMPSSYYDYAALSVYAYEYFSSSSAMTSFINGLSLSKPWFIAETAYPYTEKGFVYLADTDESLTQFVSHTKEGVQSGFLYDYPFTPAGQANFLHDFVSDVYSKGGKGVFYWEPAWSVNKEVGWASTGSKNVQASMGLFSFQGKALGNLDIFSQLLGLA